MQILSAEHIGKTYGEHCVLNDISLCISRGEAVAFVGENGCGKSTLIRILCGLTRPTKGRVCVSADLRLALVPDRFDKVNMTIPKFMSHMLFLDGAKPDAAEPYYKAFLLEGMLDTPMKYLSKGTLQKAAVIQALAAQRDILFLDEPLSGQDASSQSHFALELRKRKAAGMAIVMACHEPFLIEELADTIYQIKDGILIDGESYVFERARTRCVFLAALGGAAIMDKLKAAGAEITVLGQLVRIEADVSQSKRLFALLTADEDVRIVKYDETEGVC